MAVESIYFSIPFYQLLQAKEFRTNNRPAFILKCGRALHVVDLLNTYYILQLSISLLKIIN